jgi:Zn finger protein HypA/HybF involved in hydrogenase expression
MGVAPIQRSLEQELFALLRGASLECLVCGEFVLHVRAAIVCPECRSLLLREELAGGTESILAEIEARTG